MPVQKVDEETIIRESLKIFRQKSYHQASMAEIAKACGLLKGSLYHYFDSKEDLMSKVIHSVHDYFREEVFSLAYQEGKTAEQKLRQLTKKAEDIFIHRETGCVMGNLGVETALVNPEFGEIIRAFFSDFVEALKTIYKEKYPPKMAAELAERSVAEVEGSIMLARIFDDQSYIKNTHKRIINRLKNK